MNERPEFKPFPKLARLSRNVVASEKLDGSNGSVLITEDGDIFTGSRTRWITPQDDNFGFARWVEGNKEDILKLGPGHHFGEWVGSKIQRTYGLDHKRFYLFNAIRWCAYGSTPQRIDSGEDPRVEKYQETVPEILYIVPVLYKGLFDTAMIQSTLESLEITGSVAVPNYMNPEGVVIWHTAANVGFKKTLGGDGHKGETKS